MIWMLVNNTESILLLSILPRHKNDGGPKKSQGLK